jgi:hypothetical protein
LTAPSKFIPRKEISMPVYKRAVTEKRRAANRAAAARSTGPRTKEGKRRSAFNSFQHVLYATQDGVIRQAFARAGADPVQYDQLHQALAASLEPQGAIEALLLEEHDIYRGNFTWIGKKIQALFAECAQDRASADDPRVGELRELIRLERAQVADEDRLYKVGRERASAAPLSLGNPVLLPATQSWRDMTNQESTFDRQIAAKLNLLMKLRRETAAVALDEEEATDEPRGPASAPDAERLAKVRPADGANTKNAGTNPKNRVTASESAPASQPDKVHLGRISHGHARKGGFNPALTPQAAILVRGRVRGIETTSRRRNRG